MSHTFGAQVRFMCVVLLACLYATARVEAAKPTGPVQAIAQARQLLSSLSNTVGASRYAQVGREYGSLVDAMLNGKASVDQLLTMRDITLKLRGRTTARLEAAEAAAGESEGALESLYRSITWDDLSFATAAFPYWGAWIDLELSKQWEAPLKKKASVWEAKKGFRATAVQVFRPSLIYGGWLGLGYVAMAEGEDGRALTVFESLHDSIAENSSHPLYDLVSLQLRLLRAKEGKVSGPVASGPIDAREARLLRAEAQALLEQHRTTQSGARDAANRLRRLVDADYIDNELIALILRYRGELVALDLGPYTALASAEFAFHNGHYFDAIHKYKHFFATVVMRSNVDYDHIRYRYALACYKVKLNDDAARIAERLLRNKKLDPAIKKAAVKLAFVALSARKGKRTASERTTMQRAAERFVKAYPNDADADRARLRIAQATSDSKQAIRMLNNVKKRTVLKDDIQQTEFYIVARDFSSAIRRTRNKPPVALASRGISAYERFPNKQQRVPENKAIAIQMRALADNDPSAVIAAIDAAEKDGTLSTSARQGMLWARIKCLERLEDTVALLSLLAGIATAGPEGWQLAQIYPAIEASADANLRLAAAQKMLPGLSFDPTMERRFKTILIEALMELDQYPQAFEHAQLFRKAYPKSGDAYRLFALAAAKTDRSVQADRALRVITDRSDPRGQIWWDAMLDRIKVRADSTRPKAACKVLLELDARIDLMPAAVAPRVEAVRGTLPCVGGPTG